MDSLEAEAVGSTVDASALARINTGRTTRFASLSPALTDTVFALGLGDRLVGVSRYCEPPAGHPAIKLGGLLDPDLERLRKLAPDLLLSSDSKGAKIADIRALGIKVETLSEGGLDAVIDSMANGSRTRCPQGCCSTVVPNCLEIASG